MYLLYRFLSFFIVFIICPIFCIAQNKSSVEIASVEIINELVIGDETSKSIEQSLSRIKDIAVDQKENIYIADEGSMTIKVFNKKGEFLGSIGRRGRGPGEYLSFKEISINKNNKLIVVDRRQFRISKFNKSGEVLDTYLMSKENQDVVYFNQIKQLKDDRYLVLYKKFGNSYNEDQIFHFWDSDFNTELEKFGSFERLGFQKGFSREIAKLAVGSFTLFKDRKLVFAPSIYMGNLYTYKKNNDQWEEIEEIEGYNLQGTAYKNYPKGKGPDKALGINTQKGEFKGEIYSSSMGLFRLKNDYVVHFTIINPNRSNKENKWEFGVEIFDEELNFLGYFILDFHNISMANLIEPGIKAKDKDDNFYMISRKNGYPVVKKFSLKIKKE